MARVPKQGESMPATTTAQEDTVETATKKGQRRINLIWEVTQGTIAMSIAWAVIYCQVKDIDSEILNNAFFLVVSMYYVRTNHHLQGGIGTKPLDQTR